MVTRVALGDSSASDTSDASAASIDGYLSMIRCVSPRCSGHGSCEHQRTVSHQIEKRVSRLGVSSKMPARFAEDDLRGVQWSAARGEDFHAPAVPLIAGVEPADERAGINDGFYLHSLHGSKDREVS